MTVTLLDAEASPPVDRPVRSTRFERLALVVSAVLSFGFVARSSVSIAGRLHFVLFDDAMISMVFARNLADGHGLVWDRRADAVEGYTNFAWTLVMAAVHVLPVPDRLTSLLIMVLGAVLLALNLLVVRSIARRLAPASSHVPALAMGLVALYFPLVYWTLRGMEVGLVALLVDVGILLALRLRAQLTPRDLRLLAVVLAAAALTRTDAAIPGVLLAGFVVATVTRSERWRVATVLFGTLVGVLAAHTALRLALYGAPVPNTYDLKVAGVDLATRLGRGGGGVLTLGLVELWGPLLLAAWLVVARGRQRPALLLLAAIVAGQLAYSAYVGGDAWEATRYANRYIATVGPALLVLAALAIAELVRQPPAVLRRGAGVVVVALVGVAILRTTDWRPSSVAQLGGAPPVDPLAWRLLPPVLLAAGLVALALRARRGSRAVATTTLAVLGALVLLSTSGLPLLRWKEDGAYLFELDAALAREGVGLREAVRSDGTVTVAAAGSVTYFSHLSSVDLLGKMDPVIATGPPVAWFPFIPGHNKWDYAHSIGELRPDAITGLWQATPEDVGNIEQRWGYRRVGINAWVRVDSEAVDVERYTAVIREFESFQGLPPLEPPPGA